jgi:hypothetical protein
MALFTRQEIAATLSELAALQPLPIEIVRFDQLDFETPSSEESIVAAHGSQQVFSSGLLFWIKTIQAEDWLGHRAKYFVPHVQAGLCQPITEKEFAATVAEHSCGLRHQLPAFLVPLTGFQSGLRMYDDWNEVAVVAELTDAFVAFFWETTA